MPCVVPVLWMYPDSRHFVGRPIFIRPFGQLGPRRRGLGVTEETEDSGWH